MRAVHDEVSVRLRWGVHTPAQRPAGNQDVWRYHVHVFPRYASDDLYRLDGSWASAYAVRSYAARLRALADLNGDQDVRMPLVIEWMLIDCVDLDAMTDFWCKALDLDHVGTGPSGGHILEAADGSGRRLGLLPSGTAKTVKNRVPFDLRPDDQDAEVQRLEALGARRIDVGQAYVTWVVMADPEGNEFCVLRSHAQKAGSATLNN